MSNNNFSSFDFMFSDNPNKGIFEALDTYKTPKDTFVIPEIANQEQELEDQLSRTRAQRNDKTYVRNHLFRESLKNDIPDDHIAYLKKLKDEGFEPKVIYDIGSCVLHWTNAVKKLWPNAAFILFDASTSVEFLYTKYDYHIGVLTKNDGEELTFYQNDLKQTGNSYFKEIGHENSKFLYNEETATIRVGAKLDTVVKNRGFPLPDLVKIDVQGAEKDLIHGGEETLASCKHLIVEMQKVNYNDGAPLVGETKPYIESLGFTCVAPLFCDNGPDGDYGFVRNVTEKSTEGDKYVLLGK